MAAKCDSQQKLLRVCMVSDFVASRGAHGNIRLLTCKLDPAVAGATRASSSQDVAECIQITCASAGARAQVHNHISACAQTRPFAYTILSEVVASEQPLC